MEVAFDLEGVQPILFHADDVMENDRVRDWIKDPRNKELSRAGDDRTPPWTWQTYLYVNDGHLAIPTANIMKCLSQAGAKKPLKGNKTYKELTQSDLLIPSLFCEFTTGGKPVPMSPIAAMADKPFAEQFQLVKEMGFKLLVKRARVDKKKHVRVRAQFDHWKVSGTVEVERVEVITFKVLEELFQLAGRVGLLDWRPGSPMSPGVYGMFKPKLKKLR